MLHEEGLDHHAAFHMEGCRVRFFPPDVHGAADEVAGNKLFPVDVISSFKLVIGQNK